MENKKDIGKAFRDKLDGLHKQPGNAVWDAIKADLPKKKPGFLPLFWLGASTAIKRVVIIAAFILVVLSGYFFATVKASKNSFTIPENSNVNREADSAEHSVTGDNSKSGSAGNGVNNKASKANALITNKKNSKPDTSNNLLLDTNNKTTGAVSTHAGTTSAKNNIVKNGRKLKSKTANTNNSVTHKTGKKLNYSTSKNQQVTNNYSRFSNRNKEDKSLNTLVKGGNNNTPTQNKSSVSPISEISNNLTKPNAENNSNTYTKNTLQATDTISKISDSLCNVTIADSTAICKDTVEENSTKSNKPGIVNYKRFYIFGYGTPTTYTLKNALLPDALLAGNTTNTEVQLGYGAYMGYNFNGKWGMRAGIAITGLEHITQDAILQNMYSVVPGTGSNPNGYVHILSPANYTNVNYSRNGSNAAIIKNLGTQQLAATVNIIQKIEFAEVPVEITYNAFGDKFGAGIIAGISTIFTTKNVVYAQNNKGTLWLGSNKNVKDIGFSTIIGLNFYYRPLPYLQINAEPVFKYYVNSFSNNQPYSFGLQAGLQFNFDLFTSKK